jgi:hypothetical protein
VFATDQDRIGKSIGALSIWSISPGMNNFMNVHDLLDEEDGFLA